MRCYQEIGLKEEAKEWLKGVVQEIPDIVCPYCKKVVTYKQCKSVYAKMDSFYGDGPVLHEYILHSGLKVKEIVQSEVWSSGPVTFFCLQMEDKSLLFQWTEEEMAKYL